MKRLLWTISPFAAGALIWLTLGAAADLENVYFSSVRVAHTNFVNELVSSNGITLGGVRNTAWPAGGGGFAGAVSNNVASAGLLAVDATKTNGIAATSAHVTTALGFTPLAKTGDTATGFINIKQGSATGMGITNTADQVALQLQGFAGQNSDIAQLSAGGTNLVLIKKSGAILSYSATTASPATNELVTADYVAAHGGGLTNVTETNITLSAVTTLDSSITKHGFLPMLPNDPTLYPNGVGAWTAPSVTTNWTYINDMTDSWTNAGTVFNGIKMVITNTASAINSKAISLELSDGTILFSVDKSGVLTNKGQIRTTGILANAGQLFINDPLFDTVPSADSSFIYGRDGKNLKLGTKNTSRWEVDFGDGDIYPTLDNTYNIGTNTLRPKNIIYSGTLLGNSLVATNGNLQFGVGTTNVMYIDSATGNLLFNVDGGINIGAGALRPHNLSITGSATIGAGIANAPLFDIAWSSRSGFHCQYDGSIEMYNNAGTDFKLLQFGGTTTAYAGLGRQGAGLAAVNATNTAPSFLLSARSVLAKTTNYTLVAGSGTNTAALTDIGKVLSNFGASSMVTNTLPAAVAGYTYTAIIEATNGMMVVAGASDSIQIAGTQSAAAGWINSTNIGNSVTLVVGASGTNWMAISHEGTWTFGP